MFHGLNFNPIPYQVADKVDRTKDDGSTDIPSLSAEFQMLAATASYLQGELEEQSNLWKNSPFEWILQLPARKKGKLARHLLTSWLAAKGISVETTGNSSETLFFNGLRLSTKFSTLWTNGVYKFQQIRAKDYDYLICFGISPFDAHCWIFDRNHVIEHATPQHYQGTKIADYWIEINPNQPETWTKGCGRTLDEAFKILKGLKTK